MSQLDLNKEHYFKASSERVSQARRLCNESDTAFALSMYCSGLSVECMLRAFRLRETTEFESRHDLLKLLKESKMRNFHDDYLRNKGLGEDEITNSNQQFKAAMTTLATFWMNNFRYVSESRMLTHIKKTHSPNRLKQMKGDLLKAKALELLDAAELVVQKGIMLWE